MKINVKKAKYALFTIIVALIMAFVVGCQTVGSSFLTTNGTAGTNDSQEESGQLSVQAGNNGSNPAQDNKNTPEILDSTEEVESYFKGYSINGVNVNYEEGSLSGNMLYDSLMVNNRTFGEKFYTDGKLSGFYFNQYYVENAFDKNGRLSKSSGNDIIEYIYDDKGRIEKIYLNNVLWKSYLYSDNGPHAALRFVNVIKDSKYIVETDHIKRDQSGLIRAIIYKYSDSVILEGIYSCIYEMEKTTQEYIYWPGGIVVNYSSAQSDTAEYDYGYTYSNKKYMTKKIVSGDGYDYFYTYEYINDVIVSETCYNRKTFKEYKITYILDNELKRVGFYYNNELFSYVFDIFGNVTQIIDANKNPVVNYEYDLFGKVTVTGSRKDDVGLYNSFSFRGRDNWLYDRSREFYYIGCDKIFDVKSGSFIKGNCKKFISDPVNNTIANGKVTDLTEANKPSVKESLSEETLIKEKVAELVAQTLIVKDINSFLNILVWKKESAAFDVWDYENFGVWDDENGMYDFNGSSGKAEEKVSAGRADLYTVIGNSQNSWVFGSQAYMFTLNNKDSIAMTQSKLNRLTDPGSNNYVYDGADRYYAYPGEIDFSGHLIYLDKYITYKTVGNGVVAYSVKTNKQSNYDEDLGNLYNFDTGKFVLFNTGSLDNFKGIELVSNMVYEVDWQKINDDLITALYGQGYDVEVEGICVTYYSEEAAKEYAKNTQGKVLFFGGYDLDELRATMGDNFSFTSINGETVVTQSLPSNKFDTGDFLTKVAIGTGIILISATIITFTGGSATPIACFLATSATLAAISAAGGALAAGLTMASGNGTKPDALRAFSDGFLITAALSSTIALAAGTGACFKAGTKITTLNGIKMIENIKAGDSVLSYNEITRKTEYKKVLRTYVKKSGSTVTVYTDNDKIVTTPEHPFYVNGRWVKAGNLRAGDRLTDVNGKKVTVEQVQHELLENPLTVYNFEVEDNHNYYVGSGLLVHNLCGTSAAASLPAASYPGIGIASNMALVGKVAAVAFTVAGIASIPSSGVVLEEGSMAKAAATPRTFQMNISWAEKVPVDKYPAFFYYQLAYEYQYKLRIHPERLSQMQAAAILIMLGQIDIKNVKFTESQLSAYLTPGGEFYAQLMEIINSIPSNLRTTYHKTMHFGVFTEFPDWAMALGLQVGCVPNENGFMTGYLVANDVIPGYYHWRGPGDKYRIWFCYPLYIINGEIFWKDPRRGPDGKIVPGPLDPTLPPWDTWV